MRGVLGGLEAWAEVGGAQYPPRDYRVADCLSRYIRWHATSCTGAGTEVHNKEIFIFAFFSLSYLASGLRSRHGWALFAPNHRAHDLDFMG